MWVRYEDFARLYYGDERLITLKFDRVIKQTVGFLSSAYMFPWRL